jgi:multidrug efflux pump subunit AcrB
VLLVFLRDWRLTVIAAVTLPAAVIPTFAFLWLFGGSVNLMSMGGLAVAIGLVIDDAVVVVENIHRRAGEGGSSVADAVQQLLGPLVSSTLTTVVVFAPLGLLSGVPGQFFRALSLSLSVAVLLSLGLSIAVVPVMAGWAASHHRPTGETTGRIDRTYGRLLNVMVSRPVVAVAVAIVLAVVTVLLFYQVGTGFFPAADEGGFVLDYLSPAGSALGETDRQVRAIEKVIAETPEVASYSRRTGSELGLFATAQNTGDILVRLKPRGQRSRSSDEIISDVRERAHAAAPLVEIEFIQLLQDMLGDLEGNPEPIEIKIFGDDPDRLAELAEPVEDMMNAVTGVVDVVGVHDGNPR